jgi:hypothetical protein
MTYKNKKNQQNRSMHSTAIKMLNMKNSYKKDMRYMKVRVYKK